MLVDTEKGQQSSLSAAQPRTGTHRSYPVGCGINVYWGVAQCPVKSSPVPEYDGIVGYTVHGGVCVPDSKIVVSDTGVRLREGYEMDVDVAVVSVLVTAWELAIDVVCEVVLLVPDVVLVSKVELERVGVDVSVGVVVTVDVAVPVGVGAPVSVDVPAADDASVVGIDELAGGADVLEGGAIVLAGGNVLEGGSDVGRENWIDTSKLALGETCLRRMESGSKSSSRTPKPVSAVSGISGRCAITADVREDGDVYLLESSTDRRELVAMDMWKP